MLSPRVISISGQRNQQMAKKEVQTFQTRSWFIQNFKQGILVIIVRVFCSAESMLRDIWDRSPKWNFLWCNWLGHDHCSTCWWYDLLGRKAHPTSITVTYCFKMKLCSQPNQSWLHAIRQVRALWWASSRTFPNSVACARSNVGTQNGTHSKLPCT